MLNNFIFRVFLVVSACLASFSLYAADRLEQPALIRENADQSLLLSVAQSQSRLVSVGEQGVILLSDDNGEQWRQAPAPVSTLLTAVKFSSPNNAWAVGHDGAVLSSSDNGETWQVNLTGREINQLRKSALEKEVERLSAENADPEVIENLTYALDDAVFAIEDGPTSPLLDVLFTDANTGFITGAYGILLSTQDGGSSWNYLGHRLPNPDGLHINRVYQLKSGRLLLLGEAGLIITSDDQGNSWQQLEAPYYGSYFSAVETDALYIFGLVGHSFRYDELNNRWEPVSLSTEATINDAIAVNDKLILAGQGGALLRQNSSGFSPIGERQLRSFSSLVFTGNTLVLTGETGITRITLGKE